MKTHFGIYLTAAFVLINVGFLRGAPSASQPAPVQTVPAPTPYAITTQDGNSRVWERTVYEKAPDGTIVPKKHSYTELATGLNFTNSSGQLVASKEEIDILPNGTAQAVQGQHQAYFPGDIYQGQIELVTPDGVQLHSRPMGLSYDDGTNIVLIAVLTNSIGAVSGTNQVIYPNAFSGVDADLLYTYRKGGFEQDIVLREQPPTPESLGLNAATTRLQVLTEFFNPPEPVATPRAVNKQDGLADTTLTFGTMKMIRGRAFSFGETKQAQTTPVYKSWVHLQGRTFLVEELPIKRIAAQLEALPVAANATVSSANSILRKASATRLLTPMRLAQASTNTLLLAKADFKQKPGVVLDYDYVIEGDGDSISVFEADTTYYINGWVNAGNPTFEGGAVLKFNPDNGILNPAGVITCPTDPYHPAIFTSMDDDLVGVTISESTGSPVDWQYVYDDYQFFDDDYELATNVLALQNLRVCYGGFFFDDGNPYMTVEVSDCQFVQGGIQRTYPSTLTLQNVLFDQGGLGLDEGYDLTAENVTANTTTFITGVYSGGPGTVNLTNCIIFGDIGSVSALNTNCTAINPSGTVFQSAGGGNYYLAAGSPYRNVGTTNIDSDLLADIRQMTTYPPVSAADDYSVNTVLYPRVQRDTDTPDLGYHYDAIDYLADSLTVETGATLTLTNGAVLALTSMSVTVNGTLHTGQQMTNAEVEEAQSAPFDLLTGGNASAAYTDADGNGLPDWWEQLYFGTNGLDPTLSYDGEGNSLLYDYMNGISLPHYSFYLLMQPLSQTVVGGDTVTFSVITGGNTNLTFQWATNGVNIAGANGSSYTLNNVQDADSGNYTVTISDGTNSLITANAQLTADTGNVNGPDHTGLLNFMTIESDRQDYTFKSGVTYYISQSVRLYGHTTIEAGAVIKPDWYYDANLVVMGSLTCQGEPYMPAILTSVDDEAAGVSLGFSSSDGPPQTVTDGLPYLDLTHAQSNVINNLRFCFADWGVTTPATSRRLELWDCQFAQCNYGVVDLVAGSSTNSLHNVLFSECGAAIGAAANSITVEGEQVTADVGDFCLASATPSRVALTNSIVWGDSITASSLSTVNVASNPNDTNFVSEGYGNYYLAASSPLHQAGTANISARLQGELKGKTTYAPLAFAADTPISGNLTLSPQVPRYTNGAPDLGYYYDALDYSVGGIILQGGSVNVLPGTAIAVRNEYVPANVTSDYIPFWPFTAAAWTGVGFDLQAGSSFVSHGMPGKPNIFTAEKMVQETPEIDFGQFEYDASWGFGAICFEPDYVPDEENSPPPALDFRFTKFYLQSADYSFWSGYDTHYYWEASPDSLMNWTLQDCELQGGQIGLGPPDDGTFYGAPMDYVYGTGAISWDNNSFEGVNINLDPTYYWYDGTVNCDMQLLAYNNLFKDSPWMILASAPATAGNWVFRDNLFDQVQFDQDPSLPLDFDHNGYWPLAGREVFWGAYGYTNELQPTATSDGSTEVVMGSAPPYQAGTFGNYYLPTSTLLYNAGSRSVADAGLAQYTTQTNQTKDTSQVDIGLHYVAASSSTNATPKDTDGDGIPDYMEDANGNGSMDDGETSISTATTVSGVLDATNSVYDDVDLDGDGLTGAAERFFGTNPTNSDNPLNLLAVPQQNTFSGLVQIPLNIGTNVDTNTTFILQVNGIAQNTVVYQTNGNWFAVWDTTAFTNGSYQLNMEYDLDEDTSISGATKIVNAQNDICFPNNLSICGDALFVLPQTVYTNGTFTMDVYDDQTNLITSLSGDIDGDGYCDDPNTGNPGISISLLDTNGDHLASETYTANITASGASGSSSATKKFFYSHPWSGHRWVIAYYPCYGTKDSGSQSETDLGAMMEYAADKVHGLPAYGTADDAVVNNNNATEGNPYSIELDGSSQWNQIRGLLADSRSENFFYFGHGSSDFFGVKSGNNISSADLVSLLNNNTNKGIQAIYGSLHHAYRFVFLDGCKTSKGNLPAAFGIPSQVVSEDDWDNKYHMQPRAFLGWKTYENYHVNSTINGTHTLFIVNFWDDWGSSSDAQLQNSLTTAALNPANNQRFTDLDHKITLFGDPTLPFYQ